VHDVVRLDAGGLDVPPAGPGRWIDVALAPRDAGRPPVATQALLLPSGGVSVLSDIDDTVKVSEVRDTRALLERTFLRAFEPVDGAAARYRAWERAGATFHYVSASPWQLHAPLAGFLAEAGFPRGTLHLREFRLKDRSALSMFDDAEAVKRPQLEALLESFPERRVVLVGDSGERDPETYGALARAHPGRVLLVAIRDVTGEPRTDPRYEEAFRDLPDALWVLFTHPDGIPPLAFEAAR
jgi:phosphatidate phosphatase APP1